MTAKGRVLALRDCSIVFATTSMACEEEKYERQCHETSVAYDETIRIP